MDLGAKVNRPPVAPGIHGVRGIMFLDAPSCKPVRAVQTPDGPSSQSSIGHDDATKASGGDVIPSLSRIGVKADESGIERKHFQSQSFVEETDKRDAQAALWREVREQIYQIATAVNFRRGTTIFSPGADAQFIYFIDEGVVRISRCAENGHRQVLAFQVAGDLIGLPDNGHYANLAQTLCPVRVHRVHWSQMLGLMLAEPQIQHALLYKVVHDTLRSQSLMMVLGQQKTHQRLASCLVHLLKVPQFFDEQSARLQLPANRFDLADYIGMTPRSAERAFVRLEKLGLVRRVRPRIIEILDMDRLKSLQLQQRKVTTEQPTTASFR